MPAEIPLLGQELVYDNCWACSMT